MSDDTRHRSGLLGWGALVTVAALGTASAGFTGALLASGVLLLVLGLLALLRGRVRWTHLGSRTSGALSVAAALGLLGLGGTVANADDAS